MSRELFFDTTNRSAVHNVISEVINKQFGQSFDQGYTDQIMHQVFSKYSTKPPSMTMQVHIDNLNKLSINEAINYVKQNMNVAPNIRFDQPGQAAPLPFQQIDTQKGIKSNSDVLLAQMISERSTLDTKVGRQPVNLPNLNQQYNTSQRDQINSFLKSQTQAHPAVVQEFLNMNTETQQKFAMTNPPLYNQIMSTIHSMNDQYINGKKLQSTDLKAGKGDTSRTEENTSVDADFDADADLDADAIDAGSDIDADANAYEKYLDSLDNTKTTIKKDVDHTLTSQTTVSKRRSKIEYLSLDFRRDVDRADSNKFSLIIPSYHNVTSIELESCTIQSEQLLVEPSVYIVIDELDGDYTVSNGSHKMVVFGKLHLDKCVSGFIRYKPEHCIKIFDSPVPLNKLTISFLRYDGERIPLGKLNVKKISKSSNNVVITTFNPHHLFVSDRVNVFLGEQDSVSISNLKVVEVKNDTNAVLEKSMDSYQNGSNLAFEKAGIKCTLTFKIKMDLKN